MISWKSEKHCFIVPPLVELGWYLAMREAVKEVGWLTEPLGDLGSDPGTTPIPVSDSRGALAIAQNPIFQPSSTHTKHSL